MKRRLILHVGPHKTGSTAIQKLLADSTGVLQRHGYIYPRCGFYLFGQHKIPEALLAQNEAAFEELVAELNDAAGDVILSSEIFSLLPPDAVQRLGAAFKGFEVSVVFYLRSFICSVYSWWQETIKQGSSDELALFMAAQFARPHGFHLFDSNRILNRYARGFDESSIRLILYDEVMRASGDVAPHFFNEVLQIEGASRPPFASNSSMGPFPAEAVRVLNWTEGRGGIRLLQDKSELRAWVNDAAQQETARRYLKTLPLSYGDALFNRLEKEMAVRWSGAILGPPAPDDQKLFRQREIKIRYIDPTMWVFEQGMKDDLFRLSKIPAVGASHEQLRS